jgi:hypothetical protein
MEPSMDCEEGQPVIEAIRKAGLLVLLADLSRSMTRSPMTKRRKPAPSCAGRSKTFAQPTTTAALSVSPPDLPTKP